jgi:DNA (cytosine-5)-methyltransferase 1
MWKESLVGYRAISLFSGAGGMDVGFESAGFEIVLANELDHDAAETWRANRKNGDTMIEGDIKDVFEQLRAHKGIEVLFGGPPCQGFSVAGKMNPDDPRSKLIWSFLDAVEIVEPAVFVMENVKALGGFSKWNGIREKFLEKSQALGYECFFQILNAADFGVPQNRERVVFVGIRKGTRGQKHTFTEALRRKRTGAHTIREAFSSLAEYDTEGNEKTCTANVSLAVHPVLRKSPYAGMLVNGAGRPADIDGVSQTLPASMGGNKTPIVDQGVLEDPGTRNWFEEYHEALIKGEADPRTTTVPKRVRRLTLTEAAALQTFPQGYLFCGKKTQQYKQIGNAVACNFSNAIAGAIKEACL